jgi:hypothetical protein
VRHCALEAGVREFHDACKIVGEVRVCGTLHSDMCVISNVMGSNMYIAKQRMKIQTELAIASTAGLNAHRD